MSDFDGTGPLKRGRIIGRGQGHCKQNAGECPQEDNDRERPAAKEKPAK